MGALTFCIAADGMPCMKRFALIMTMLAASSITSGCVGLPSFNNMFYPVESDKPDYDRGSRDNPRAAGRPPLDVPPELRNEVSVPMPDKVATEAAQGGAGLSEKDKKAIAGNAVSLDARVYDQSAAKVFSSVIDAMTALNMPVASVDSPSGTITTAWVRHDSNNTNAYIGAAMDVFGAGPVHTRYRFIVRVFRTKDGKTQLQIRTLGQQFISRHWVNKPIKRKVAKELFAAVEERLVARIPDKTGTANEAGAKIPPEKP